ncbi:MAG: transposase, partial [Methyloprofundus sp.]|nr:transposase [Methyloprofundus sp.]
WIYIQKSSIELATKQGLKQGLEQGSKQEKINIAKKLIGLLDNKTIAEKTGLSLLEVESL